MKFLLIIISVIAGSVLAQCFAEETTHTYCDVCGKDLTRESSTAVQTEIGMTIESHPGSLEYEDMVKLFGKDKFNICYIDFLKAFGVKTLEEKNETNHNGTITNDELSNATVR